MKVIELIIDENKELTGVDAVSLVESPAIDETWVALNNQKKVEFAEVDKEKRLIMGALLVPERQIYRRDESGEYMIWFSKDTIRKCMEMFFQKHNQSNATFEHLEKISGLTMVESWIVEDTEKDKSNLYNLNVPVGTWVGSIKVENDKIWNDFVKTGAVKGFSIEGYFADKMESKLSTINEIESEIFAGLDLLEIKNLLYANKSKIK
jgi:hypothetical protein